MVTGDGGACSLCGSDSWTKAFWRRGRTVCETCQAKLLGKAPPHRGGHPKRKGEDGLADALPEQSATGNAGKGAVLRGQSAAKGAENVGGFEGSHEV